MTYLKLADLRAAPVLAAAGAILVLVSRANAVPLAYEGFEYPADTSISGQSGGSGWTNAWASSASGMLATNVAGSLSYSVNGYSLVTSGGSLVVAATPATSATPNRALEANLSDGLGTTAGAGRTNWISFLYQRLNFEQLPYLRQANFALFEGAGERVNIGGPNTSATISNVMSVWSGNGSNNVYAPLQAAKHPINAGATHLVLIKVVADSAATPDTAFVWFNWTNLLAEPATNSAALAITDINLSSVNTLRLQAGNNNATIGTNASFQVDELRVGTTFADVTPHQVAAAAPEIASPPQDQTVTLGDDVTFGVTATGDAPLRYQWYFNTNTVLTNATSPTLTLSNVGYAAAGGYSVVVTNIAGAVTSPVATLTVLAQVPAAIATQPQDFTNVVGFIATFSVAATGTAPLAYQWYFNAAPLASGTNATLTFPITAGDAGSYFVIVTNRFGAETSSVVTLTTVPASPAGLPAFPGADGAAKYITGGRGGLVYHVTNLDRNISHNEAGTLRYGLTDGNFPPGVPRTIVFDVAGTFWLGRYGAESNHFHGWDSGSRYNLPGNVTLAGQSAPGPVIIAGGVTKPGGANLIVRNVTFAPSYGTRGFQEDPNVLPTVGDFPDSYVFDVLDISGQNVLLDHLTCVYGTDETISCNELAANLTIQYCTIAQGENYPQADAENPGVYTGHALGSLLQAGSNAKVSVLNNFYAHLKGRLPRVGSEVGTGAFNDFRNNIFYNWLGTAGSGASGQPSYNNFINNFYLAGDGGDDVSSTNIVNASGGTGIFNGASSAATRAYVVGNLKDTNKDADPNDSSSADGNYSAITAQSAAYDVNLGVTLSASAGFTNTLRYSGARWWARPYDFTLGNTNAITTNDIAAYVEQRLVKEAATGTGKIVAWADDPFNPSASEGWEWRALLALRADPNTFAAPFKRPAGWDTDGDGMPEAWELAHGLNPNLADNNADFDADGYTDLEEYLNELAAWPAPGVIQFTGSTNSRYAEIFNWRVNGQAVNIAGQGTVTTYSLWQPSRYDTALISNRTVIVDAVGQHAGTLRLTNNAALTITNGWLAVANQLDIAANCTVTASAGLRVTNSLVNRGTLRLTGNASLSVGGTFTNTGTLDVMTWSGTLPAGLVNTGTILDRSLIVMSAYGLSGTNFTATIQGYAGHNYQLQYRDDLASGAWQNVGAAVPGASAPIVFGHPGGGVGPQRYYRVAVNP
jgi:hypothetical protein